MTHAKYGFLAGGLIAAWFAFSLAASSLGLFAGNTAGFGLPVAIAALTPLLLFFLWFAGSSGFREFTLSLDPRILAIVQTWRVGGFVFVVLAGFGLLPRLFAYPAGFGDMLIGATAPLVAFGLIRFDRRLNFIVWQSLGILDLVNAVALGTTASLITSGHVDMTPMTVLPLSIVPTFLVPLFLILHVISIAQARRWPAGAYPRLSRELGSSLA